MSAFDIAQPFKKAHREINLLTGSDRAADDQIADRTFRFAETSSQHRQTPDQAN